MRRLNAGVHIKGVFQGFVMQGSVIAKVKIFGFYPMVKVVFVNLAIKKVVMIV